MNKINYNLKYVIIIKLINFINLKYFLEFKYLIFFILNQMDQMAEYRIKIFL